MGAKFITSISLSINCINYILIIITLFISILQPAASETYKCTSVGKFVDYQDPHRYHQCFFLFGILTYIHNTCPFQTCYNPHLNYCHAEACKMIINPPGNEYICKDKNYKCTKQGIFADEKDTSIYFKCSKIWGKWVFICYTCNSKHHTCFSNELQACIPNDGKPCGTKQGGNNTGGDGGDGSTIKTTTYDCEGYNFFPCYKLGIGLHMFPGDRSVYMQCTKNKEGKMEGKCHCCPKKRNTCFVEVIDQCIERCGLGSPHKPYNCSTFTIEDVPCETEGLIAHSTDTSVFFNCFQQGTSWDIQCFTCSNGKTKTCFSEIQQACVTYSGAATGTGTDHKCPPITVIDAPEDSADVGTADNSLTWDCDGYNELSFPCKHFEPGEYDTPADRSVYFQCNQQGSDCVSECKTCPSTTWSCYDPEKEQCKPDCVSRVHLPYDCRTYHEHSYPCTQTGFFSNLNDTSIYYQCVFESGSGFNALCYACSGGGEKTTCYDNDQQACVTNGQEVGRPCGTIENLSANPDKGTKQDSLTYSKEGYSETSFPCEELGPGEWDKPGDQSVYVKCGSGGETEFLVCPKDTLSCYVKEEKRCVENCGLGVITTTARPIGTYTCQGAAYNCTEVGVFQYDSDTSIYISCQKIEGNLKALCFSCNSVDKTCYSEEKQSCIQNNGAPCGDVSSLDKEGKPHLSYNCEGYSENSFPCEGLGPGFFGVPGDKSVFVECYATPDGALVGRCHCCLKAGNSCYDDKKKVCVKNCGKGDLHKPYDCSTYNEKSYPCTRAGFFANSFETSIYFQCVKVNDEWKAYCYTCNSRKMTCYNEKKKACVSNNGMPCGNTTMPVDGGTKLESLTFCCKGYNKTSFPCDKVGPGTYVMPGDQSVYWTCGDDGQGECNMCPVETRSCYVQSEKKCIEKCGRGPPPKPYNCSGYTRNSFNCIQEGIFANPKDSSVYFRCKKDPTNKETPWRWECFTCNSRNQTCFDDIAKACVDNGGRSCGGKTVEVLKKNVDGKTTWVAKNASRMYTCAGYEGFMFQCKEPGNFTKPGDKSIYFTCKKDGDCILPHCNACQKQQKGCFIKDQNKCVDNCGKGAQVNGTIRAYDCSGYHVNSFPCQKEGLFANPMDHTVFFRCLKNRQGNWESWCYSCNSLSKSCFKNEHKRCILGCLDPNNPEYKDKAISLVYGDNCRGYGIFSVPCNLLTAKQSGTQIGFKTYYHHPGDPAVYFLCVQAGMFFQALCHMCPLSSCFDQTTQDCIAPCPDYVVTDPNDPINVGPPWPYDCRFYTDDSYPCTENGVFANPVDTSVYFQCEKDSGAYKAICYTCNSKLKTCYNELKATCMYSTDTKCGKVYNTNGTVIGKTYDCEGYEPLKSLPCSQVGAGNHSIPGDESVYFTCEGCPSSGYTGTCHTCDRENSGCWYPSKNYCRPYCILAAHEPYACHIYDETSFHCTEVGFFAQTFESSVFFECVKAGKHFKSLCHTCNSHLKTCFSNKLQVCITKGGQPCLAGDPHDSPVGGTEEGSRHHTCQGYNDCSFPCSYYKAGLYGTPADLSIYFSCVKVGENWVAECRSCSKEENGCFDGQKKICLANCGKGEDVPYRCHSYDDKAIDCKKEGFFRNPKDSSVFFRCVKTADIVKGWKTYCYSCNSNLGTCYDKETGACLTFGPGVACKDLKYPDCDGGGGNGKLPAKGDVEESRSYDCSGYNELSIPCDLKGPGKHVHPADKSVYFECVVKGGELVGKCHQCDASRRECFVDREQKCVENCGLGPHKQWDCSTRRYKCVSEGTFADLVDVSVFHKCVKKANGKLESQCFSCSSGLKKTCFSEMKQACLHVTLGTCCKEDPAGPTGHSTKTPEQSRTYDCRGYNQVSFPCSKYPVPGPYHTQGDSSVYFECQNIIINGVSTPVAECKSCCESSKSIFDPGQKKCVANSGKGQHQPYNCKTYNDKSFKCTDAGLFANPVDSSVFFKCVMKGDKWESHCYSCSSTKKTCFDDELKACITNSEKKCGGGKIYATNDLAGTAEMSRTYDCSGYNEVSFPCEKHSPAEYGHPGDLSVYFKCEKKDENYIATCKSCEKTTWSIYNNTKGVKACVINDGKGPVKKYNCRTTHSRSYPCTSEGGYWASPEHTSLFFKCIKHRGALEAICYTCSINHKTCWSDELQACVTIGEEEDCGCKDPIYFKEVGTAKSSRTWTIHGYRNWPPHFPCAHKGEGCHYHPGDASVYVRCIKKWGDNREFKWEEKFIVCGDDQRGGYYNKDTKKCETEPEVNRVLTGPRPPTLGPAEPRSNSTDNGDEESGPGKEDVTYRRSKPKKPQGKAKQKKLKFFHLN